MAAANDRSRAHVAVWRPELAPDGSATGLRMHAHRSLEMPHAACVTGLASIANGGVAVTMQSEVNNRAYMKVFDCKAGASSNT
jgi:hypothetical protein